MAGERGSEVDQGTPSVPHAFLCCCSLHRFDRTLGGLEMELRLREHLARLFNEQRKGQRAKDVRENPRAMAKLLREANRLKTVLSANVDHMAQVPPRSWSRADILHPGTVDDPTTLS